MVPAAEQCEIRELRRPPMRRVVEMMPLGDANTATREATAPVPMLERAPEGGRNGPRPRANRHNMPFLPMAHHCAARVTGESSRRFRGNVRAALQYRLSRRRRGGPPVRGGME